MQSFEETPDGIQCVNCFKLRKDKADVEFSKDRKGHILCDKCGPRTRYDEDGKLYCRECVMTEIGNKDFAITLIGILGKLKLGQIADMANFEFDIVRKHADTMITRGWMTEKRAGAFVSRKLFRQAWSAAKVLANTFSEDEDFKNFMRKMAGD